MDTSSNQEMSEGRLKAVIDSAVDGIIVIDRTGIVTMYSPSCEALLGYGADEVIGQNVKMLMPEPYHGEHDGYLRNYLETGEKKIIGIGREVTCRHKDGSTIPINLSVGEFSESGNFGFVGIIHDLTKMKKNEAENRQLGRIVEHSLNEIFLFDAESLLFDIVNQSGRDNLGYSMDELKAMTPVDIKPEFTEQSFAKLIQPLRDGTELQTTFETVHQRKDGSRYHVEVHLQLMSKEDPPVFAAIMKDITETRETRNALEKSEAGLARAQQMAGLGSWERDLRTGEIHWSAQQLRNMGLAIDELGNDREDLMSSMVHPEDQHIFRAALRNLEKGVIAKEETLRIIRPDGDIAHLSYRLDAETDQDGNLVGILGTSLDVTDAKKAQEELSRLQNDLHHASRLTVANEMAAALAHELNQPLTAIANYAEACDTLLKSSDDESRQKVSEYLAKAVAQSHRAGEIIRRLREFTEKGETKQRLGDINQVVREACELFLSDAPGRGITVVTDYGENIPAVLMDRIQIQQVVTNLVRNAMEAMADMKGGTLTIRTAAESPDRVDVSVSDTGHGLPDEVAENLFKPFTTTKPTGMGMGLSISKTIIEAHGGEIEAAQNKDSGVTFSFTLPFETD